MSDDIRRWRSFKKEREAILVDLGPHIASKKRKRDAKIVEEHQEPDLETLRKRYEGQWKGQLDLKFGEGSVFQHPSSPSDVLEMNVSAEDRAMLEEGPPQEILDLFDNDDFEKILHAIESTKHRARGRRGKNSLKGSRRKMRQSSKNSRCS